MDGFCGIFYVIVIWKINGVIPESYCASLN